MALLISALKAEAGRSKFQVSKVHIESCSRTSKSYTVRLVSKNNSKSINKSPVLSNNKIVIKPNTITRHFNTHYLTKEIPTFVEGIISLVKSLAPGHRTEEVAKLVFKPKLNYNTLFPHSVSTEQPFSSESKSYIQVIQKIFKALFKEIIKYFRDNKVLSLDTYIYFMVALGFG